MTSRAVSGVMLPLLFVGMLGLVIIIQSVEAAVSPYSPAEAISVIPGTRIIESDVFCTYNNTEFTVEVIISNITDCAGYQFVIDYDAALLELSNYTFDTDPAHPLSSTQMAPAPANRVDTDHSVPGSVKLATVWTVDAPTYNFSGDSVAAEITFRIIYCPPQIVATPRQDNTVSSDLRFDQSLTRACDYWGDDIYFSAFNDGYYEYTTLGQLVEPSPASAVGGKAIPINNIVIRSEFEAPRIGLGVLLIVVVLAVAYILRREQLY